MKRNTKLNHEKKEVLFLGSNTRPADLVVMHNPYEVIKILGFILAMMKIKRMN